MDKHFILTNHAKQVIRERGIQVKWVAKVIRYPNKIERDKVDVKLLHHLGKIPERGSRALRVVLNCGVSPMRVVTAYFDRNLRHKL